MRYYHRTHKNYNKDYKGKVDKFDMPLNLYSIANTDKEVPWVYSKFANDMSEIGYHQVIYGLSRHVGIYSNVKMRQWLDKDKTFNSLLKEDNLGRKYILYRDYRKWAADNARKLRLTDRQRKEIALWILGL